MDQYRNTLSIPLIEDQTTIKPLLSIQWSHSPQILTPKGNG